MKSWEAKHSCSWGCYRRFIATTSISLYLSPACPYAVLLTGSKKIKNKINQCHHLSTWQSFKCFKAFVGTLLCPVKWEQHICSRSQRALDFLYKRHSIYLVTKYLAGKWQFPSSLSQRSNTVVVTLSSVGHRAKAESAGMTVRLPKSHNSRPIHPVW